MYLSSNVKIFFIPLFTFLLFLPFESKAVSITLNKSNSFLFKEYKKVQTKYAKELCRPGTEEEFNELNTAFRGTGNYLPILLNDKLDKKTIQENLHLFDKKIKWIKKNLAHLKKKKNFREELVILRKFSKYVDRVLEHKRRYYESSDLSVREKAREQSKEDYAVLKKEFLDFLYKREYILGFEFPVDHLKWRSKYDQFKNSLNPNEKQISNSTYFYRKIVEDGAQDADHTRNDIYTRANLNTLILSLKKDSEIISENIRYDLEDAISRLEYMFKRGVKKHRERNQEWLERVEHSQSFYKDLLKNKVKIGKNYQSGIQIIKNRSDALLNLKNFVLDKQAKSYQFWMKENPIMRQIFVIETILFNEVGRVDVEGALERNDVAQVVLNRTTLPEYAMFSEKDNLYQILTNQYKISADTLKSYPWLNVLYKQGEFSFTYFFIGASVRTFCADMSYHGRKLRDENIYLSLNLLKNPNKEFNAVRYFSRASMLGRIDMAKLWKDFYALEERPGTKVNKSTSYLLKQIKKGNYRYLYNFRSKQEDLYEVLEIESRPYTYLPSKKQLYHYRNPHFFTYFSDSRS